MRENAIMWIVGLTVFVALGIASIIFYVFMQGVIEGYFLS
jgi:hypothetical protein